MKKLLTIILTMFVFIASAQEGEKRFVYELTFEFSPNASFAEAEKISENVRN